MATEEKKGGNQPGRTGITSDANQKGTTGGNQGKGHTSNQGTSQDRKRGSTSGATPKGTTGGNRGGNKRNDKDDE